MNKKRDYITVTADVDVYLDDYFDDFMDLASDENLIQEIEKRGHKVLSLCSLLNFTILIVLFPNSCIISIF